MSAQIVLPGIFTFAPRQPDSLHQRSGRDGHNLVDIRRSDSGRAVLSTYHAVEENVLSSQSVIDSHSEQISYRKDRIDNDNHDKGLGRSQL